MKKGKIVKLSKYRKKNYLPAVLAVVFVVLLAGGIIGYHISDEYHTYKSSEVRDYETISQRQGELLLVTEKKELLGKVYAGFVIKNAADGTQLYRCPDLYPVGELLSIAWEEKGSVEVKRKDGSRVIYTGEENRWVKKEEEAGSNIPPAVTSAP